MVAAWQLQKTVWSLNLLASALVIWKIFFIGLYHTYRYFLASMGLALLRSAILFPFAPISETYYRLWVATQPLIWLSYILVVFELYSLALKRYQGIYSLSRWFFLGSLAASMTISALTLLPTMSGPPAAYPLRYYYALAERGVVTSLAFLLFLLLILVAWFPVPLSRNLVTHASIYTAYFFVTNVIVLFWHLGPKANNYYSSVFRLVFAFICYLCWVLFLSHRGEDRIASLRLGRNPISEKRLLGQLETLNATLLRSARK